MPNLFYMLNQLQQISDQIKKAQSILIAYSQSFNGDGTASALALFLFLKKLNKNAKIITNKQQNSVLNFNSKVNPVKSAPLVNPVRYELSNGVNGIESQAETSFKPPISSEDLFNRVNLDFLPAYDNIKHSIDNLREFIISLDITDTKIEKIKYKINNNTLDFIIQPQQEFFQKENVASSAVKFKYDLIIVLNTPDLELLGPAYNDQADFFYKTPIINIDHNPGNEGFGQINCIELIAVSTSEILFSLFEQISFDLIDENIATCLLAGIICSTKNFKTFNITPNILSITSKLLSINARREEIVDHLYRSFDLNTLKLWGRVLARISSTLDDKLIWSIVPKKDFEITNSSEKSLINIIDELIINIPQAEIIVIIYETLSLPQINNQTNVIIYSTKNINSADLMKEYNPKGDQKIVKITINKTLLDAEKEIIELIKNKLKKLLQLT